jgi:hypothetical protein
MRFAHTFTHAAFASLMLAGGLAHAALQPGDVAPDFEAEAALDGKAYAYQLKTARQAGPVVVYFYPSAYTNGCNIQAHSFATQLDAFRAAGASVVGVSLDSIGRLREFSADPESCAGKPTAASPRPLRSTCATLPPAARTAAGKPSTTASRSAPPSSLPARVASPPPWAV